ncbi:MAG: large conductance mechanosensitive channel protein MscL [Clostridia bacterium]|nr:large conductance mechanosensitive channel protein MscL [Clostridia bacterium]
MKVLKEFKEFAMKGNILDMAIGLVIGGAFQSIIKSLVEDVIMPFTALFTGNVDYTNWVINVSTAQIKIGSFITALINFLIIALSIFIALKVVVSINRRFEEMNKEVTGKLNKKLKKNKGKKEEEVYEEPETKICPYCLSEVKYKATRCPHCTSKLENLNDVKE